MKKPNILVIFTDQQNSSMMSCTGNKWLETPNMDLLNDSGVSFENSYCANPVCLASRFSLLTGLYPGTLGLKSNDYKNEISENIPEYITQNGLGKILKQNGYKAIYGGKEHLPYMNTELLGFDYVCKDERYELANELSKIVKEENEPFCMFASFINPHDICLMAIRDFAKEANNNFLDSLLADICVQEREEVEKIEKAAKELDQDLFFSKLCPPLPENHAIANDEPEAITFLQEQRGFKRLARQKYTDEQWRMHRYVYARLTEQVDAQIGVLLNAVKEKGIWDDTVIIFTSDHGDMDSAHKMEHKTCLYNESVRVPLLVKDAKGSKGTRHSLVSNGLDLIPTILDYANIKMPEHLKGKSFKSCVENDEILRDMLVIESEFGKMVANKDGAYHKYDEGKNSEQYYDYATNIGQMYNQICDEKYAELVEKSRECLTAHFEEIK